MRKTLAVLLMLVGLCAPVWAQGSGQANVSSGFVDGDLYFYDKSGNEIFRIDGTNRKMLFPSGSVLDVDAASGILLPASGEIVSADIAADTIVAADIATDGVEAAEIAASAVGTSEVNDNTLTANDLATSAVATAEILDGTILNVDIDAAAAIARSKLAEDALAVVEIPIANARLSTFAVMGVSAADDNEFHLAVSSNAVTINSDSADNTTDTSTFRFMVRIPENYSAAAEGVQFRFRVALIESGAAATDNGSSIDLQCYEQGDGSVGADIVSTAAQTFAATDTWYNKDFALTASDLVAGDLISCLVTGAVIENNAGAETITMKTNPPVMLVDVKG